MFRRPEVVRAARQSFPVFYQKISVADGEYFNVLLFEFWYGAGGHHPSHFANFFCFGTLVFLEAFTRSCDHVIM